MFINILHRLESISKFTNDFILREILGFPHNLALLDLFPVVDTIDPSPLKPFPPLDCRSLQGSNSPPPSSIVLSPCPPQAPSASSHPLTPTAARARPYLFATVSILLPPQTPST